MAVGPRKRAKLRSLAAAWLRDRGYDVPRHRELRFDVVGLRLDAERPRHRVRAPARRVLRRVPQPRRSCE